MDTTIEEIMKLVDSYKDAQASRRFGKLPLIRKAIQDKLTQALQKTVAVSACGDCNSCQKQCQSNAEQAQAAIVFEGDKA